MELHGGHRQRMYEKLKKDALAEHEWLEMLLYAMAPRRNTNDIAHRLLRRFGTVEDMLAASMEELQSVEGVGVQIAAHLKCIEHFYKDYKKDTSGDFTDRYTVEGFLSFLKTNYQAIPYEIMNVYLLDGAGYVIKKQGFSTENISQVLVNPELLSAFCLTAGASGVVMVHNHPSGCALPSKEDDLMTKNMQVLCSMHNLLFCDHIIYAERGIYSYYLSERLQEITKDYAIDSLIQ